MLIGRVVGTVWSTVKWPEIEGLRLLVVRPYSRADLEGAPVEGAAAAPDDEAVVCGDVLGAGIGEDVVFAYGHAARVALSELLPQGASPALAIDAAVIAIVDQFHVEAVQR
jgi:ethanolamine utilization protein EutN